jgi:phosphoribosylaminoimidazolecarboxamide formyltransferase/IMP cyclohydrolase
MSKAVQRALISVSDKTGLVEFAQGLAARNIEILSTGGTYKALQQAGLAVREVSEYTGFPEMMDGRVKTLHPRVHGGLLFRRDKDSHVEAAEEHGIPRIDLLVVDLYPFETVSSQPDATRADCVEMIDIGGPAMIRAAAKNHAHVLVVTDPGDLSAIRSEMEERDGGVSAATRSAMAAKAYARTASYDAAIASYLTEERFPERLVVPLELKSVTRYGENPHQPGAVYMTPATGETTVARAAAHEGSKELSYNNYLDASGAWDVVRVQAQPAVAFIKHRNPCGAAVDEDLVAAFRAAHEGDPLSAFGGIVAVNRAVDLALASEIADPKKFLEVIVAPAFTEEAVEAIRTGAKWGKNARLLALGDGETQASGVLELRSIGGGILVQERDEPDPEVAFECVTQREPDDREIADLRFAWDVVRNVTSNAIVFVNGRKLVGCGAGQMSRVDSVELASKKAADLAKGAVMASDAFFPFPDGILAAAEAGVTAVVQPGGSIRDAQIVKACDDVGLAMLLTHRRHFRH